MNKILSTEKAPVLLSALGNSRATVAASSGDI
jgi:hypothetical protein